MAVKLSNGIDITNVKRMKTAIQQGKKRFLERVFSEAERDYCDERRGKYEHYAVRFAAKEAFIKALGKETGYLPDMSEIEIRKKPSGKPYIYLKPTIRKKLKLSSKAQIELSLSHERDYAVAMVVMLQPS